MGDEKLTLDLEGDVAESIEAGDATITYSAVGGARLHDATVTYSAVGGMTAEGGVSADLVSIGGIAAKGDVTVDRGMAGGVLAGGNVSLGTSVTEGILAAGDVTAETLAAVGVAGRSVSIKQGWVGIVAAPEVSIAEGVRVAFDPRSAAWLGAAFGAVFALVFALARSLTGCCRD